MVIHTDGTMHSISKGFTINESITYADYKYNSFGALTSTRYGIFSEGNRNDTVSQVDYWYNALGQLVSINDIASVVDSSNGNADHFGLEFGWYDGSDTTYANGRPTFQTTANSKVAASGKLTHTYEYTYNELGWLEKAVHQTLDYRDREYHYNSMGNRDFTVFDDETDTTLYRYDSTVAGSSKLLWMTGMGDHQMKYDVLGNMIEDSSRQLYSLEYDYRNLMTYSEAAPSYTGRDNTELSMTYDQMGRRISKKFKYEERGFCEDDSGIIIIPPGDPLVPLGGPEVLLDNSLGLGGAIAMGGPGGGEICYSTKYNKRYYLWDRGQIIAVFDDADDVVELFTYGIEGRFMTQINNNDILTTYLIKDQLGSMRVAMSGNPDDSTTEVREYMNFHPFGALSEASGNYYSSFQFTGHEHDEHSTFDFHYMGARYYDDRTGQFTGIDKAGEFASGYNYCGNNPITRMDPDGNHTVVLHPNYEPVSHTHGENGATKIKTITVKGKKPIQSGQEGLNNGLSPESMAYNFGCTKGELAKLNLDQLRELELSDEQLEDIMWGVIKQGVSVNVFIPPGVGGAVTLTEKKGEWFISVEVGVGEGGSLEFATMYGPGKTTKGLFQSLQVGIPGILVESSGPLNSLPWNNDTTVKGNLGVTGSYTIGFTF